jgi:ATP-dependent Clp protease ATP-binding subunit ClpC
LALQAHLVEQGVSDVFDGAPVEVALAVEPALDGGSRAGADAWCRQLREMYRAWAGNRHMQVADIAVPGGVPILAVSGFGAHRVLARECGLHVLELAGERVAARVRLAPTPLGDLPAQRMHREIAAGLDKAPRPSAVVRRYRSEPSPLVRNADGSWRSGRLDAVLRGDFDLVAAEETEPAG